MKTEKITYTCDNPDCETEKTINKDQYAGSSIFDKWVRVYMKPPMAQGLISKKKYHFCCKQCAVAFMGATD